MEYYKTIEEYFTKQEQWTEALEELRALFAQTEMIETLKWGAPTYTVNNKNVAGMAAFKSYVGIWFHQGVFLKDEHKKLINAQEGVTKALRQWRFDSKEDILAHQKLILAYLEEAIENQKLGKELKPNVKKELIIPQELQQVLDSDEKLNQQFQSMSLSKKRDFAEYISSAKRAETKLTRLEKITPMIQSGIGLNDKYK